ncbi:uncharacterized protein K452DRAFT_357129 [Aplosporella prunicola CBS 121167]|uniref:NADPH-dependent diflavin oxidoreductase 1 n=1 Tax=Aplosporella prunicola CBS 121167 TaxID=1176127 RepID=A0A6A6BJ89_9PEZI|nr:uncharacterized protein K452DRAFT_357129 [Aplosporella prunicola CBS 121167]KAF2144230.1 hypothetical protein K452DRAFT_357129 [Aplosporella prunicola CBS 121167]
MTHSAIVTYGSETGNAEEIAAQLSQLTRRLRIWTTIKPLNALKPQELESATVVLIVISTTGQGDLPRNAQALFKQLRSKRLPADFLKNVTFASFGLGDSSYTQFNYAHRKLKNRLEQLGAQRLIDAGEGDEQHPEGVDATFIPWVETLRKKLLELCPPSAGQEPVPEDVFIKPRWFLQLKDEEPSSSDNQESATLTLDDYGRLDHAHVSQEPDHEPAEIVSNQRVTPDDHWQDVRQLEIKVARQIERKDPAGNVLEKSRVDYNPGDIAEIYPKNFPSDVEEFISLQGYKDICHKPLDLKYDYEQFDCEPLREHPLESAPFHPTIFGLLVNHLDLMSVPRRSFFALIAHFASDSTQKERLLEFACPTDPEVLQDYFDYTTRPRRSILEVLQEFTSVKIPYQYLLGIIPPIKPRQFSIASADSTKLDAESKVATVTLLIAIVKYRTVIKRIRHGVCSRYLSDLQPGQLLRMQILKGAMRVTDDDLRAPSILIGPGTGIAPLRSIIQGKELLHAASQPPAQQNGTHEQDGDDTAAAARLLDSTLLVFGARSARADFYFQDEWADKVEAEGLHLATAFSRDQRQKIYVQDRVREQGKLILELLKMGGRVYLCGASGKMPEAVRAAIVDVLVGEGGMERERAEEVLKGWVRGGRVQQETW